MVKYFYLTIERSSSVRGISCTLYVSCGLLILCFYFLFFLLVVVINSRFFQGIVSVFLTLFFFFYSLCLFLFLFLFLYGRGEAWLSWFIPGRGMEAAITLHWFGFSSLSDFYYRVDDTNSSHAAPCVSFFSLVYLQASLYYPPFFSFLFHIYFTFLPYHRRVDFLILSAVICLTGLPS